MSSLIEAQRTIDELKKALELTRNEKARFEMQTAVLTEDRDNWKKIADAKEKDLDHLKVHYDCCVSDRDMYNNKVSNLTSEVDRLEKELEAMTNLNNLNINVVKDLEEENQVLLDKRRVLSDTVSQLEKRLADANENWKIVNRNSIEWQDKAERIESYTAQLESDYREICATLRESVKAITAVASKLK